MNPISDQQLQEVFAEIEPGQLSPEFQDHLMHKLAAREAPARRFSPARVLAAYWLLAAGMMVVVLAHIAWLAPQWSATTLLVTLAVLALSALPLTIFTLKLRINIADLIWNTLEE
jgi:hypothetical protein